MLALNNKTGPLGLVTLLLLALQHISLVGAIPLEESAKGPKCRNPIVRKEW